MIEAQNEPLRSIVGCEVSSMFFSLPQSEHSEKSITLEKNYGARERGQNPSQQKSKTIRIGIKHPRLFERKTPIPDLKIHSRKLQRIIGEEQQMGRNYIPRRDSIGWCGRTEET